MLRQAIGPGLLVWRVLAIGAERHLGRTRILRTSQFQRLLGQVPHLGLRPASYNVDSVSFSHFLFFLNIIADQMGYLPILKLV